MEYNQFSDIKGIFKNFFHKKEDFNNKGLISKKENFNNSTASTAGWGIALYLITSLMYVGSVFLVGLLPQWKSNPEAFYAFLYVSALLTGQGIYYYYGGGEEEISDLLKDSKFPVGAAVGFVILGILTIGIRYKVLGYILSPYKIPQPAPPNAVNASTYATTA